VLILVLAGRGARAGGPLEVTALPLPQAPSLEKGAAAVPPPAPDLTAFLGKPVRAVEAVLEDDPWQDIKAPILRRVRLGEPFSPELARAALLEAVDSGTLGDAKVNVIAEGDGVRIRVHGVPRRLVDSIRVELHKTPLEREEILREAGLEEGGEVLGNDLDLRKRRIEVLLARHGFPQPQVDLTTRQTDAPTRVLLLLDINGGVPREVQRRVFYVFGAKEDDVRRYTKDYSVDKGDRADEPALQEADASLGEKLRTAGWYEAEVSHDVVLVRPAGSADKGVVTLRVRVDAGPRYLPRFEGAVHYDADALTDALGVDTDPDHGPQHLADKLRRYYVSRGFLDATVAVEMRGRPTDPTRFMVFVVNEGQRVVVASRGYPCVSEADIHGLTGGGPSSASAIGREIDSFLDEDLPGADFLADPNPRGVDALLGGGGGSRVVPIDLDPNATFAPETYDKAVAHVQELYRNEGFLSAMVGPVQILRRRCDPKSPAGRCVPVPFTDAIPDACAYDRSGLPLPVTPLDARFTCVPDPARGVECEPRLALRVPIKLGPRTTLHDVAFYGAKSLSDKELADAADLALGQPANTLKIDEARRRIVDRYREEGFFYADVKFEVQRSMDNTHARVRFDITEGDRVIVRQIVIEGNKITNESVILRRVALEVGKPYRASLVRRTQERIATLNVFSSVSVVLQNPQVPQRDKVVIITVHEKPTQYFELAPGFSTGEGLRLAAEYGYTNIFGSAVSLTLRGRVSYLPDFLIADPSIAATFATLKLSERIAYRVTLSLGLPDILLGPDVRMNLDGVYMQDVERFFLVDKAAVLPTVYWRPHRQHNLAFSGSAEYNNLFVFNNQSPAQALAQAGGNLDVQRLLRAPAGQSEVFSQRVLWTWDRRDNSFNAHEGTYLALGAEHVDWFPIGNPPFIEDTVHCTTCAPMPGGVLPTPPQAVVQVNPGHFLKLSQTFSGYFPLPFFKKIIVAATLRLGEIIQFDSASTTYPDRYFFMGGIDSLRSFQQDSMMPQDAVDQINASNGRIQPNQIAIRGGNLMVNPRIELRIPITGPLETVIFLDTGNLWQDASYPLNNGITLRAAVGSGIRVQTPVGPIALDYGINLTRQTTYVGEDFGALNFAIGLF